MNVPAAVSPSIQHVANLETYEALPTKERAVVLKLFRDAHFTQAPQAGSTKNTCKHCSGTFVGSVVKCVRHFLSKIDQKTFTGNSNLVAVCTRINASDAEIKRATFFAGIVRKYEQKEQQKAALAAKKERQGQPPAATLFPHKQPKAFAVQEHAHLDKLLMELVVANGLPAAIVEAKRFKTFCAFLQNARVEYKLPRKKALGADADHCEETGLGRVLKTVFHAAQLKKIELLRGVDEIGGTLVHDGAKHHKRNVLNAALMTHKGPLFVQATDASGVYKNAEYLADDVMRACSTIGWRNVFLVAMDGAGVCMRCLAILQQTAVPPMDVEQMPFYDGLTEAGQKDVMAGLRRIFTQRCATHAGNLVANDIGKMFEEAIRWSVKLVVFLSQHDFIYAMMLQMPGDHALVMAVETRFAKQIYSTEHLLKDMVTIKAVLNGGAVAEWLLKQKANVRAAHKEVTEWVALDSNLDKLRDFVAVEVPVRVFIRRTDGHAPSLGHTWADYHVMRSACIAAAQKLGPAIEEGVREVFDGRGVGRDHVRGRERDCVSDAALAAAAVMPEYALDQRRGLPNTAGQKLLRMMRQYFSDPTSAEHGMTPAYTAGKTLYIDFTKGAAIFESNKDELEDAFKTGGAQAYWANVALFADDQYQPAIGFFIRLVTAHSGQGGAERQNKQVKKFRTTTRNRQTHKVTAAYMEIDTTLRMRDAVTVGRQTVPYLKAVRWAIQDALDEAAEDEEQGGGERGGHADGDDGGGGLDEEEPVQRALGWQVLIGMFHRGVDEPLPFAQGDAGDVDGEDANP